jgi:TPR repeat protein
MHLLVTDPSTSPRTDLGRIIFGILYGLSVVVLYALLESISTESFYDKLLAVPILNLMIQGIDRAARSKAMKRFDPTALVARLAPRRRNLAYMSVWVVIFAIIQSLTSTDQELARQNLLAHTLLSQGQVEGAISHFRVAAERGDAEAQSNLGVLYVIGEGVGQDDAEAVRWYRKSAEQGFDPAQFNLGGMYERGAGVAQDYVEAARWYRAAAEQGNAEAQTDLGILYATGRGVALDNVEAARWYRMAAKQGHADAQYSLGFMYATGRGVEQDDVEAERWCRKAAERGNPEAQYNLGSMYATGWVVEQDPAEAERWYRQAAEQGHAAAQCELDGCPDARGKPSANR